MGGSGGLCESCWSAGYCTIVSLLGVETLCWMGLEGLVSFFRSGWDVGPGGSGGCLVGVVGLVRPYLIFVTNATNIFV